jgi:hypothetical protein
MNWAKLIKALLKTTGIFGACALLLWGIFFCITHQHLEIIAGTVALSVFILLTIALYEDS